MQQCCAALLPVLAGCLLLMDIVFAANYMLYYENEKFATACEEYPDDFLDKWFDYSMLDFKYDENNHIVVSGKLHLTQDAPDLAALHVQIYKRRGGKWLNTIYNLKRSPLCTALFDPKEIWYKYTKNIPVECPPKQGFEVPVNWVSDVKIPLPRGDEAGDYKANVLVTFPSDPTKKICFNIFFHGDRIY